jgi:hypothetical protein
MSVTNMMALAGAPRLAKLLMSIAWSTRLYTRLNKNYLNDVVETRSVTWMVRSWNKVVYVLDSCECWVGLSTCKIAIAN